MDFDYHKFAIFCKLACPLGCNTIKPEDIVSRGCPVIHWFNWKFKREGKEFDKREFARKAIESGEWKSNFDNE